MATVLHRTTTELRRSANTPEYDPAEWLINPVLPECDSKYWVVSGDVVREANEAERLEIHRAEKLSRLPVWYASRLSVGVAVGALLLKVQRVDQDRLAGLAAVCNTGLITGVLSADSPCPSPVWDAMGAMHSLTVGEFCGLALQYAAAVVAIEVEWQAKYDAIVVAASQADLDAIDVEVSNG